jgi:GT2 family glycosyltransferase
MPGDVRVADDSRHSLSLAPMPVKPPGSAAPAGVSVIIACHTEARWDSLRRAIESVAAQQPPAAALIVAVDNNPALGDRLRQSSPAALVVDNRERQGASSTRNAGAAAASTPFLAFLDDDATARANWLNELLEPFGDGAVVGTGGAVEAAWDTARPAWFPQEFAWVVGASYTGLPETTGPVRNVWSENMAVRREAFEAVGGFRSEFGKVGHTSRPEDTDLCIRMSANVTGGHWIYAPAAIVDHEVPAERATIRYFLKRSFWEGRGKVEMTRHLGEERDLSSENDWLRRTVPRGVLHHLRTAAARRSPSEAARAGALVAGTLAAGLGAASGLAPGLRRPG